MATRKCTCESCRIPTPLEYVTIGMIGVLSVAFFLVALWSIA